MQTKDQMPTGKQWKRPKDWKVVTAVAAASALGISGLALAGSGDDRTEPEGIDLRERANLTDLTSTTTHVSVPTTVADALQRVADSAPTGSADSPFDSPSVQSAQSVQSPSPQSPPTPDSPSPQSPTADSPSVQSAPSPDSPSPQSAPSPDSWSPDSGSADS